MFMILGTEEITISTTYTSIILTTQLTSTPKVKTYPFTILLK